MRRLRPRLTAPLPHASFSRAHARREQQLTQKAAGGAKGSKGEDLVSYVEQQHDYR